MGRREIELPSLFGRKPSAVWAAADRAGLGITPPSCSWHPRSGCRSSADQRKCGGRRRHGPLGAKRAVFPIVQFPANMHPASDEAIAHMIARSLAAGWRGYLEDARVFDRSVLDRVGLRYLGARHSSSGRIDDVGCPDAVPQRAPGAAAST